VIVGSVDHDLAPIVRVGLTAEPPGEVEVEAAIDTGFTGHLILPQEVLNKVQASPVGPMRWRELRGRRVSSRKE
jgi:predicted aspartyl protease